jgi:hypothetical protein
MADIKAKDIAIASSVASNDLILGSSIAGTTANVTVETVGKYIINQLNLASLSNQTVLQKFTPDTTEYNGLGKKITVVKICDIVFISSPEDMQAACDAGNNYIFSLPAKYRPTEKIYGWIGNVNPTSMRIIAKDNGDVILYTQNAIDSNVHSCAFFMCYTTKK